MILLISVAACFLAMLAIVIWLARRLVSAEDNLTHERLKTAGLLAALRQANREGERANERREICPGDEWKEGE